MTDKIHETLPVEICAVRPRSEASPLALADVEKIIETLGTVYRILVDGAVYELRATGAGRWDLYGTGEHEQRMYGPLTIRAGLCRIEWRFPLRTYGGHEFGRAELVDAIRDLVDDRPTNVDPLDLVERAEQTIRTLVAVLNDPDNGWSGDYPELLGRFKAVHEGAGALYDHVHEVAIALAADKDSTVWGRLAERAADSAEGCARLVEFGELCVEDARAGMTELAPVDFVRGILSPYFAARAAEAGVDLAGAEQ